MISIVLPTYNGEKYIEMAIRSILQQTYSDFEVIIVDDCSTDKTNDIIKKMAKEDSRIRIIHNEINQKLPKSLNIGFENAKGTYYTWSSDDNIFHKDAFEKMVKEFEDNKEVDIVYSLCNIINDVGESIEDIKPEQCQVSCMYHHDPIGACFLYKRQVHEKLGGYDANRFLIEDYDFWLRAYRYFTYKLIPEKLYDYRRHEASLTSNFSQQIETATVNRIIEEMEIATFTDNDYVQAYRRIIPYYYYQRDKILLKKYIKKMKQISEKDYRELPTYIKLGARYGIIFGRVYSRIFRSCQ